jgi:AcrR family transcriptional regulator
MFHSTEAREDVLPAPTTKSPRPERKSAKGQRSVAPPKGRQSASKNLRVAPKNPRVTAKTRPAAVRPKTAGPKGKRSTRGEQKEATRQKIVDAALYLFEKKGFDKTTTKAIAQRAGIAEGTVFNYFQTKDDIALHFFEQEVDHAIETVRANPRLRKAPLEEKLFALVQAQIDYLAPYEHFIGASVVHALRPGSKLAFSAKANALRARYVAFVEELIEGSFEKSSPTLSWIAPHAFWIYYLGVLLYWLHDTSEGKQNTLAFLDRSLQLGVAVMRSGVA